MNKEFDIQEYMTKGVEKVVASTLRATLSNPRESTFMVKFAAASRTASQKRQQAKKQGENIPPFLVASITSSCNLHCGDYLQEDHAGGCVLYEKRDQVEALLPHS